MANRPGILWLCAAVAAGGACSGGTSQVTAEPAPTLLDAAVASAPPVTLDAGPSLSETAARAILAERFRAAGLRVLHDVTIEIGAGAVTLDGYDPQRRVGFEYVDARERGGDLDDAEAEALAAADDPRVLVVAATDERELRRRVDRFLGQIVEDAGAEPASEQPQPVVE